MRRGPTAGMVSDASVTEASRSCLDLPRSCSLERKGAQWPSKAADGGESGCEQSLTVRPSLQPLAIDGPMASIPLVTQSHATSSMRCEKSLQ